MKKNIIISVVLFFLAICFLFIGFVVTKISLGKIKINPKEIEATIVKIEKEKNDYLIIIKEYECKLFVDSDLIINDQTLMGLSEGERIYFKLVELEENFLKNSQIEQIGIVSLRNENQDIITESNYYEKEKKDIIKIKTLCIVVASVFGLLAGLKIVRKRSI